MSGLAILEVIIGLGFLYLQLSLVCSALNELLSTVLSWRARMLAEGLRGLLADPVLRERFYAHPLITSLSRSSKAAGGVRRYRAPEQDPALAHPTYIPARLFSLVVLDIVVPAGQQGDENGSASAGVQSLGDVRRALLRLPNTYDELRRALLPLIDSAGGRLDQARENVERWYNDAMDRVGSWYRRRVQQALLLLALLVTVAVNADSIALVRSLWRDPAIRAAVVASADEYVTEQAAIGEQNAALDVIVEELAMLNLPLGWRWETIPVSPMDWSTKIAGLLFTAFAVSLGAPFWYDLLNRLVQWRGVGKT